VGAGGVGGVGTLLGPEGAGNRFFSAGRTDLEGLVWQTYVWDWPDVVTHLGLSGWWVWSMSVWVGSARSLRTAQWTRASLFNL
jgi:hypothetical protein